LDKNLQEELESEQIKKYKESINNIILTNYHHFIFIRNNQKIFDIHLFNTNDLSKSQNRISTEKINELLISFDWFFTYSIPVITTGEELALELSRKAKLLRELVREELDEDASLKDNASQSSVYDFFQGIKELISDITIDESADAYAQTMTYGLFLARIHTKLPIRRETASSSLPRSIPIIRIIFANISYNLPPNLSWIIDEIIDVLNASEIKKVLSDIDYRDKKDRDPYSFFYEDFLARYDPEKRKALGVYYTPRPVISFIAKSVNLILKSNFNKVSGFAEDDVTVLDPAVGTGTFLWLVYLLTLVELKNKGLGGIIRSKIKNHILSDFYGFEILISPYIFAHIKLSIVLSQWFYEMNQLERIPVYLTNTLEPSESHGLIPFMRELNEESRAANEIKQSKKVLVLMSNPPYSGTSANKSNWIRNLLKKGYTGADGHTDDGYFYVEGKPLKEKNPKWLQDDYVKFIRFAQWKIDRNGEGIVGYITNHGYIDNPTFNGMRYSLLKSFNRIYILNLHGSVLKKDLSPDGSKDENVFDIKQGVAIGIFVKTKKFDDTKVFHADLFGTREFKFEWLDKNTINSIKLTEVKPNSPQYLFVPQGSILDEKYKRYWDIREIFPVNSVGIVTARDNFSVKWTEEEIWNTVSDFARIEDVEVARTKYDLGKDARDWKVDLAQKDIVNCGPDKELIIPILYRPFDIRYTYYTGNSRGFHCMPRPEVMNHMRHYNIGLVFIRREELNIPYSHFLVTDKMVEHICLSSKTTCYLAPLYLYSKTGRKSNINPKLQELLKATYNERVAPERIFYYIYAITCSPNYRAKFNDNLRRDFPRIPFVKDRDIFVRLSQEGEKLVNLHVGHVEVEATTKFDKEGSNIVEHVKYEDEKIFINKDQFFDEVPSDVWKYNVGSYQVLEKWLKSRRKRELVSKDIEYFLKIIEIIKQTIMLTDKIDEIVDVSDSEAI
jgi:predicted helicase